MKFLNVAVMLLPLAALATPDTKSTPEIVQPVSVTKDQPPELDPPSKSSNIVCRIVNTSSNVNCRSGPGFSYPVVAIVIPGSYYLFHCYKSGSCYNNNCTWDQVSLASGGVCYVNGYYTDNSCTAAALGRC